MKLGNNYHKIMELMWLAIAVITTVMVVIMLIQTDGEKGWGMAFMPVIAVVFFFFRRYARRKMEKDNQLSD